MKLKSAIPAIAACLVMGGASVAVAQDNRASAYGGGIAGAGRDGAVAGGVVGAEAKSKNRQERRGNRGDRRGQQEQAAPNASSTYGTGAVYTDRRRSSAAVTSGGSASGTGSQSTSSTVDAYGETTRDGSSADIYGNSTAESRERRERRN